MAGCLDNVQLPNVEGCIDVGEKRNKVASIVAGILVSICKCNRLGQGRLLMHTTGAEPSSKWIYPYVVVFLSPPH